MILSEPDQREASPYVSAEDGRHLDICESHLARAEREMGAFLSMIRQIHGPAVAELAADYWIEFAGTMKVPLINGNYSWRHISIASASRVADGILGQVTDARSVEGSKNVN